jgi:hypothetical protein
VMWRSQFQTAFIINVNNHEPNFLHAACFFFGFFSGALNLYPLHRNHEQNTGLLHFERYVKIMGAGTAQSVRDWLWAGRPRGRSSGRVKSPLLQVVQTGSGVHPTSYLIGTGGKVAEAQS